MKSDNRIIKKSVLIILVTVVILTLMVYINFIFDDRTQEKSKIGLIERNGFIALNLVNKPNEYTILCNTNKHFLNKKIIEEYSFSLKDNEYICINSYDTNDFVVIELNDFLKYEQELLVTFKSDDIIKISKNNLKTK